MILADPIPVLVPIESFQGVQGGTVITVAWPGPPAPRPSSDFRAAVPHVEVGGEVFFVVGVESAKIAAQIKISTGEHIAMKIHPVDSVQM